MNKFIFLFVFAMMVFASPVYAAEPAVISVSGEAAVTMEPDVAYISLGVETHDDSPLQAQTRNSSTMSDVIAAIRSMGIDESDIQTTHFFMHPLQDWSDGHGRIVGHQVSNIITVTVRDIDTVGAVLSAATEAGANMSSNVSFGLLDSDAAYNRALAQAIADATAKARTIAQALGHSLGDVLHVSEMGSMGAIPSFPMGRGMMAFDSGFGFAATAAGVPVQGGELAIIARVHVTFAITP